MTATPEELALARAQKLEEDTLKAARDYVWKSFDLHFKQRNEFIRFYTGILLPIYAAYGVVNKEKLFGYGLWVALFAMVTTWLFYSLDRRARKFMWDYEAFLRDDEDDMARILRNENVKLFAKSRSRTAAQARTELTYTDAYKTFFALNFAAAVSFGIYCACYFND